MSVRSLVKPLLDPLVANRVWMDTTPDEGPGRDVSGNLNSFILLSVMGGEDAEYVDQTMGDKTHVRLQVSAFAPDTDTVETLIRAVRDSLLESAYSVGVYGSPVGTYDAARKLRVRFQQFSILLPQ